MIVFIKTKAHEISFEVIGWSGESQEDRERFRRDLKASYTNLWGEEAWVTFSDDPTEVVDDDNS